MQKLSLAIVLAAVLTQTASPKILGVFQGKIVQLPSARAAQKWVVIQSRNGFVRRVEISKAVFTYDEDFPVSARRQPPQRSLCEATEVRVTAIKAKSKKGDGAWSATEVLILSSDPKREGRLVQTIASGSEYCQ